MENYRNLQAHDLAFSEEINVIFGDNAQGKSNLLESIWIFTGGHSFRGAKDSDLNAFGQKKSRLLLYFYSEDREQTILLELENGKRTYELNGVKKKTGAEMIGRFCAVIFSPEHLSLVKGGPGMRRSFLDGALCQGYPSYAKAFVLYQRTLKQRNMLLKEIQKNPDAAHMLPVWDTFLAQRGIRVMEQRKKLISFMEQPVRTFYHGLSGGKEDFKIRYISSIRQEGDITEEDFLGRLAEQQKSDIVTGFTSVGPHRDDMELMIDGVSARDYGSQGQQRSAVIALKLAEADMIEEITGEKPVILLDDVMSELDAARQDYLLNHIRDRQIFITCCDPNMIRNLRNGKLFSVENGTVTATEGKSSSEI